MQNYWQPTSSTRSKYNRASSIPSLKTCVKWAVYIGAPIVVAFTACSENHTKDATPSVLEDIASTSQFYHQPDNFKTEFKYQTYSLN